MGPPAFSEENDPPPRLSHWSAFYLVQLVFFSDYGTSRWRLRVVCFLSSSLDRRNSTFRAICTASELQLPLVIFAKMQSFSY